MSLTLSDVLARVKPRIAPMTPWNEWARLDFDIAVAIPTALNRFGEKIANDPRTDIRNLLRKNFSVTITSGVGDLSTALTGAEPLIINEIMAGNSYVTNGTQPCQHLPDRTQLGLTRPNFFIYYCIDSSNIRTRNTDGSLSSLNTTLTITGNYAPLLSSVPSQMEDEFIDAVINVVRPPAEVAQ